MHLNCSQKESASTCTFVGASFTLLYSVTVCLIVNIMVVLIFWIFFVEPVNAIAMRNNHIHNGNNHNSHQNTHLYYQQPGEAEVGDQIENGTQIDNSITRWRNDTVYTSNIFLKLYGE